MRVMTWNIWWRFGPREARGPGIEATLRAADADLICLQETWAVDGRNQAAELGTALGYHAVSTLDDDTQRLGNAVLSRWPIVAHDVTALPLASGEPGHRTLLHARAEAPGGLVDVYSTHLAYRFDESALRSSQLSVICEAIARDRRHAYATHPPILCGDLNATPESDEIRSLTGAAAPPVAGLVFTDAWAAVGSGPGHTWDARNPHLADSTWPRRRLDYVLVGWPRDKPTGNPRRARLAGARHHDGVWPSDHLAVIVDLATGDDDA